MKGLTKSQAKVFDFVSHFIENRGHSPTFRDIQAHFGFASLGSVYNYIKTFKKKGLLLDQKRAPLSLGAPREQKRAGEMTVPFIGYLAQGFPIETFHQAQNLALPASLVAHPDDTYILKAKGETLVDEHIADGDYVIIEAKSIANEGELIVATLYNQDHQDTIVKRFYPEGSYVRLEASDGRHEPIVLHPKELQIQGVVVGVFRSYI
jgi:repressor LexA